MAKVKSKEGTLPMSAALPEESHEKLRARVLKSGLKFDESTDTYSDSFVPWDPSSEGTHVHTMTELAELVSKDPKVLVEGSVLGYGKDKHIRRAKVSRDSFLEGFKANRKRTSMREAVDAFAMDADISGGGFMGEDFVPMLGGPFHKQLYIYDYQRMHAYCFFAVNHWPMAKAIVDITHNFTLGRGYRVDCENPAALKLWRLFEDANNLQEMMEYCERELSTYGETMIWWLPNQQSRITYNLSPGQTPPRGLIPRVRLIDPSCIWEIVTYPEDITRVLFYQWVAPTQYQMYTGKDQGASVPGSKFIIQQIPGGEVAHFKLNCMSNEKRGRSDLFPVMGYIKRLSDSVNYSIAALQKAAAWAIDTTIEGTDSDLQAYADDQAALGTIPSAGSEFIHTSKVTRNYLGNNASKGGGGGQSFDWALSMIASGSGIPVSYFGTHFSGGQTRASAMVGTEPVTKRFQQRQLVIERILKKLAKRLFDNNGFEGVEIEVTMPELLIQDRSAKFKDLALAELQGWISKERAATIASKEFQISEFNYQEEKAAIDAQPQPQAAEGPLSQPGLYEPGPGTQGVTSGDRAEQADNERNGSFN